MDSALVSKKPHELLAAHLAEELDQVNTLIRARMASEHAPRIPEVTAHLVEAGGKRLRPMLTLATAQMCGYTGPYHIHLAATVEFIHTATLLHDDVVKVVASDGHNNKTRPPSMKQAFARVSQEYGEERALRLMLDAPASILSMV